MNLKALIVEDEEHSQELLQTFLTDYCPDVTVIGKSKTVIEAIELIQKHSPDIVFLDIELQDGRGFDVLHSFSEFDFLTVFITGYDQYSIEAIKHSAFDYILKPFSINELQETISRAKSRLKIWDVLHQIQDDKKTVLENNGKLILKSDKGTKVISVNEIIYIESDDPYCKIHLINKKRIYIQTSLKNINEMLPDYFFRIHKSHLINLHMVKEWEDGRGGNVLLSNDILLPISYRNKKEFKDRIEFLKLN